MGKHGVRIRRGKGAVRKEQCSEIRRCVHITGRSEDVTMGQTGRQKQHTTEAAAVGGTIKARAEGDADIGAHLAESSMGGRQPGRPSGSHIVHRQWRQHGERREGRWQVGGGAATAAARWSNSHHSFDEVRGNRGVLKGSKWEIGETFFQPSMDIVSGKCEDSAGIKMVRKEALSGPAWVPSAMRCGVAGRAMLAHDRQGTLEKVIMGHCKSIDVNVLSSEGRADKLLARGPRQCGRIID
jgi:hypothetical protein